MLRFRRIMLVVTLALIGLTVWLYMIVPKGFFPDQDTGLHDRHHPGTAGDLLPVHAADAGAGGGDR